MTSDSFGLSRRASQSSFLYIIFWCALQLVYAGEVPKCLRMHEERPVGSPIGNFRKLAAADLEAFQASGPVSSSFLFSFSPPNNRYFEIDNRTGDISVKTRIDREALLGGTIAETGAVCQSIDSSREYSSFTLSADSTKNCEFTLQVIVAHARQYRSLPLKVCVDDVNDNSPSWSTTTINVAIPEHRGTQFTLLPAAFDPDRGDSGRVGYRLANSSPHFRINVTSNELYIVSNELDRELNPFYLLRVNATDYGVPARSATILVNVSVVDVNDCPPQFSRKVYEVNVSESVSELGRTVFVFQAIDPDTSSIGNIHYSLAEDHIGLSRIFNLNEMTGQVVLVGALDYERRSTYRLKVNAFDGVHYADAVLHVNVLDVNDNPPQISLVAIPSGPATIDNELKIIRLSEGMAQDQAIAFVNALDLDTGNNSLLSCSTEDATLFTLRQFSTNRASKQVSYSLMLRSTLDRETAETIEIVIVCPDAGTPPKTSTATYTVQVADVNDNAPQFSVPVYSVSIAENNENGRFVAEITATDADADENAQLTYSIVQNANTPMAAGSITIDPATGRVYAQHRFDREVLNKLAVQLRATDNGVPPRSTTAYLEINIEDVNDNSPEFTPRNVYEFSVSENEQYGFVVGEVRAVDNDATDRFNQVTYSLLRGSSERYPAHKAAAWFSVNERGQLVVNGSVDYEEARSVTLRVEARDNGQPPRASEATVIIRILDVNDNKPSWQFPNSQNKTVNCSYFDTVGTLITYVSAIDLDSGQNGQILYSLRPDNSASTYFAINDLTGGLYLAKELNHVNAYHHIVLEARDRGNPSHAEPAVLGVYITDVRLSSAARTDEQTPLLTLFTDQRQVIIVFGLVVVTALLALVLVMTISYMKLRKQRRAPPRRRKRISNDSMEDKTHVLAGHSVIDAALCEVHSPSINHRPDDSAKGDFDSPDDLHPIYASHRRPNTLPTQPHCSLSARSCRYAPPIVHSLSNSMYAGSRSPNRKRPSTNSRETRPLTDSPASAGGINVSGANSPAKRQYTPSGSQVVNDANEALLKCRENEQDSAMYNMVNSDSRAKAAARTTGIMTNKVITFRSVPGTPTVASSNDSEVQFFDPMQPVAGGYLTVQPCSVGRNRKRPHNYGNTTMRQQARKLSARTDASFTTSHNSVESITEKSQAQNSPCFNDSPNFSGPHTCTAIHVTERSAAITPSQFESNSLDRSASINPRSQSHFADEHAPHSPEGTQAYEADSFKPHHLIGKPCSSYV